MWVVEVEGDALARLESRVGAGYHFTCLELLDLSVKESTDWVAISVGDSRMANRKNRAWSIDFSGTMGNICQTDGELDPRT